MQVNENIKPEVLNDFLYFKRKAVIQNTINHAVQIYKLSKVAYPKRKLRILKRNKKHYRIIRRERLLAQALLIVQPAMFSMQYAIICSQPIPKFKPASNEQANKTSAFVSEGCEPEQIICTNTAFTTPNAKIPLPGR